MFDNEFQLIVVVKEMQLIVVEKELQLIMVEEGNRMCCPPFSINEPSFINSRSLHSLIAPDASTFITSASALD